MMFPFHYVVSLLAALSHCAALFIPDDAHCIAAADASQRLID
jgi:hypothetical protein